MLRFTFSRAFFVLYTVLIPLLVSLILIAYSPSIPRNPLFGSWPADWAARLILALAISASFALLPNLKLRRRWFYGRDIVPPGYLTDIAYSCFGIVLALFSAFVISLVVGWTITVFLPTFTNARTAFALGAGVLQGAPLVIIRRELVY